MVRKKFLRTHTHKYKRIGGKKKNHKWRKARGRHNKIREGIRGKQARPKIGMKKKKVIVVETIRLVCLKDLEMVKKGQEVIIAKIGKRKRLIIEEKLKEKGAKVLN